MLKRVLLLVLLLVSIEARAQQVLSTNELSSVFSTVAGTPRIVRNTADRIWVALWRQEAANPRIVARVIKSDGGSGVARVLITRAELSVDGFDLAFNGNAANYVLVFESAGQIHVQRLSRNLLKVGLPITLPAVAGGHPRILYNSDRGTYVVFWLESPGTLRSLLLDASGEPLGNKQTVALAATGQEI